MCVAYENEKPSKRPQAKAGADYIVLKFGSSVLRSLDDLPTVVSEIYRHARVQRKVVAVVSAFAGETDTLIAESARLGAGEGSRHAPRLIALGEERSAALLALACESAGLDARVAGARQIALKAGGPVDDAAPETADIDALQREIARHDVVIVPGFIAIGETGEPVLLGRGGSDLTAVFLAEQLGLASVTLIKDVPGVFDRDPAGDPAAKFYPALSWAEARKVAGKLLQPKAIDFAAARGVGIDVKRAGAKSGTLVSGVSQEPATLATSSRSAVGVAGLGVIGAGVAARLASDSDDYRFNAALVQDAAKPRDNVDGDVALVEDAPALLGHAPDIVIDALPDGDAGRVLIEQALSRGVSIVSANKQAVAGSLKKFHDLAQKNNAAFAYAASVGGGAPMVETVRIAAAAGAPVRLAGILNGTVNFILSAVAAGEKFDDAVRAAQEAGFAEPDPTADLSGDDARAKLSILSFEAFGKEIDLASVSCEALTAEKAAAFAEMGGRWKQIARLEADDRGALSATVSFERVDDDPFFRGIDGEGNALQIINADGRVFSCKGKGAGRTPTVESLLADLGEIRRAGLT